MKVNKFETFYNNLMAGVKNLVISGFPGIGKTYFTKRYDTRIHNYHICDSDSSNFSWIYDEFGTKVKRNPEFPYNYINHIKSLLSTNTCNVIFVSSHESVRQALDDAGIIFCIMYPDTSLKDIFMQRYKDRGNDDEFINMMDKNFEKFVNDIDNSEYKFGCKYKITETHIGTYCMPHVNPYHIICANNMINAAILRPVSETVSEFKPIYRGVYDNINPTSDSSIGFSEEEYQTVLKSLPMYDSTYSPKLITSVGKAIDFYKILYMSDYNDLPNVDDDIDDIIGTSIYIRTIMLKYDLGLEEACSYYEIANNEHFRITSESVIEYGALDDNIALAQIIKSYFTKNRSFISNDNLRDRCEVCGIDLSSTADIIEKLIRNNIFNIIDHFSIIDQHKCVIPEMPIYEFAMHDAITDIDYMTYKNSYEQSVWNILFKDEIQPYELAHLERSGIYDMTMSVRILLNTDNKICKIHIKSTNGKDIWHIFKIQ